MNCRGMSGVMCEVRGVKRGGEVRGQVSVYLALHCIALQAMF